MTRRYPSATWIAALGASAVGLAGCMLIANLDQFDGVVAGAADAAAVPHDASAQAPPDATAADGVGGDADGAGDVESEAGRWCPSHTTPGATVICRDFDDGKGYLADWSTVVANPDFGSISSTVAFSPPDSMLLTSPALDGGSVYDQFTEYLSFAGGVDLQFELQIPDFDRTAGDLSLCRVAYQNSQWWVSFDISGSGGALYETIAGDDGGLTTITHAVQQPALAAGTWVNVDLNVNWGASTITLAYDGTQVANVTAANPPAGSTTFSVQVGVNYLGGPALPMHIYYDDVLLNTL